METNPENDFQSLADEETKLLEKLQEVRQKKLEAQAKAAEERRRRELEKPVTLTIIEFSPPHFTVSGEYRADVVNAMQRIPSRTYGSNGRNRFAIRYLEHFKEEMSKLTNITVAYLDGIEEKIKDYLEAPNWDIDLIEDKYLTAKPGPQVSNTYKIREVPGADWQHLKNIFHVPLTEAWRLAEVLSTEENVVWSESAKNIAIEQAQKRALLDKIATMEDIDIEVPFVGSLTPRAFQRVGIRFAELTDYRAIIGDQMGLGKTPEALGVFARMRMENPKAKMLVVCPASLKINWEREVMKFLGERPRVLSGSAPERSDMVDILTGNRAVTIINYDILGRVMEHKKEWKDKEGNLHVDSKERFLWSELLSLADFDLIVFDEAHYMKTKDANRTKAAMAINARGKIMLTGTPVLNRPGELWPLLNMLRPDLFPSYDRFVNQYTYDGKVARNVDELRSLLKTIMIRRLKKDVVKDLPPINRIHEYSDLSEKAQKLYNKVLEGVYKTIDAAGNNIEKEVTNILVQITRLKQVCAIDKVQETADKAIQLYDDSEGDDFRKVLIFSQFQATAHKIAQLLGNEALCFVHRTPHSYNLASLRERMDLVDRFQTDPNVHFLVATTKSTQEGLNITKAGHLIFNDLMWTPAAHDQAEGRAYGRLSECHSVESYYMIKENTVEEWIVELLDAKLRMIEQVVEGVEGARDESIAMAIINKLREQMWTRKK